MVDSGDELDEDDEEELDELPLDELLADCVAAALRLSSVNDLTVDCVLLCRNVSMEDNIRL